MAGDVIVDFDQVLDFPRFEDLLAAKNKLAVEPGKYLAVVTGIRVHEKAATNSISLAWQFRINLNPNALTDGWTIGDKTYDFASPESYTFIRYKNKPIDPDKNKKVAEWLQAIDCVPPFVMEKALGRQCVATVIVGEGVRQQDSDYGMAGEKYARAEIGRISAYMNSAGVKAAVLDWIKDAILEKNQPVLEDSEIPF